MADWTPERHAAARARCEAATPGPWEANHRENKVVRQAWVTLPGCPGQPLCQCRWHPEHTSGHWGDTFDADANADFIAHARTDLPEALAEIDDLSVALAYYRAECAEKDAELSRLTAQLAAADALAAAAGAWHDAVPGPGMWSDERAAVVDALDAYDAARVEVER